MAGEILSKNLELPFTLIQYRPGCTPGGPQTAQIWLPHSQLVLRLTFRARGEIAFAVWAFITRTFHVQKSPNEPSGKPQRSVGTQRSRARAPVQWPSPSLLSPLSRRGRNPRELGTA